MCLHGFSRAAMGAGADKTLVSAKTTRNLSFSTAIHLPFSVAWFWKRSKFCLLHGIIIIDRIIGATAFWNYLSSRQSARLATLGR